MLSIKNQYILACLLTLVVFVISCKKPNDRVLTRTYYMGFQNSAPRLDYNLYLQSLEMWTQRADAAMITTEVPWDTLMAGQTPQSYITRNYKGLVDYYRSKHLKLWVYIDPENGLNRTSDANALVAAGKSISQSDVQSIYKRFAFVMDSMLQPDHLGLALETNLIRDAAPDSVYQGIKKSVNEAATEIRAFDNKVALSISIQVDWAWGKLGNGTVKGIDRDFEDFSFIEELGLSSYPYFGFDNPQDIPLDYYSKLVEGKTIPVFVSEGGWSSQKVPAYAETPQKQADYIARQSQLLDKVKAEAVFQLVFTDLDLTSLPSGTPSNINLFAYLGLVDKDMQSKPALAIWDGIFKRQLLK